MKQTLVAGITDGGIYGLFAVGIVLVYKGSRVLNFAQGELGTFSLFIAWLVIDKAHLPWVVGAAAAIGAGAAVGLLFERLVVRRMGDATRLSVTVATVGLLLLLLGTELRIWGPYPKNLRNPIPGMGPEVFGFHVTPLRILSLVCVGLLGLCLAWFLRRTDFGLGVLAASQDPSATQLVGIPLARVSSFSWTVAGAISAIAALLIAPTVGIFHPGLLMTEGFFFKGLAAALLGGLTSLPGAFVGGLAIGILDAFVQDAFVQTSFPGAQIVALMILLVAILIGRPQGLLGKARP